MKRALAAFTVSHAGIRLRVRLLPSITDVHSQYSVGCRRRDGKIVHAYFQESASTVARCQGTIVIGMDACLDEVVPHEVSHAVVHVLRGVSATHDEPAATAIGVLCKKIFARARNVA